MDQRLIQKHGFPLFEEIEQRKDNTSKDYTKWCYSAESADNQYLCIFIIMRHWSDGRFNTNIRLLKKRETNDGASIWFPHSTINSEVRNSLQECYNDIILVAIQFFETGR